MAIRLLTEAERRKRSRTIQGVHAQWAAEQVAKGIDGPVPPGRKDPSDYNQHVPDLESSGHDLDDYATRVAQALTQ